MLKPNEVWEILTVFFLTFGLTNRNWTALCLSEQHVQLCDYQRWLVKDFWLEIQNSATPHGCQDDFSRTKECGVMQWHLATGQRSPYLVTRGSHMLL